MRVPYTQMGGDGRPEVVAGIDEALLRLRRFLVLGMRPHGLAGRFRGAPVELSHVLVVDAVGRLGADGGEVTVRGIADHLGVERSTASRLVDSAARAGWVTTGPSTLDRRRTVVSRTDAGAALDERARTFRHAYLTGLLADWPAADVAELARLLHAFASLAAAQPPAPEVPTEPTHGRHREPGGGRGG
jgi:DNA-binding MarR family transcriptional regulator